MGGTSRYTFDNLVDALYNPERFLGEIYRISVDINVRVHSYRDNSDGTRVIEEDWDNLVILDACRFDMFNEQNILDGRLERRRSLGSESWEFLQENFVGESHHDVVYVTANPHAPKLPAGTFHEVINLLENGWDPELQTVRPATVVDAAVDAHETYPNKRLIIHFMQPHYPFIGEHGQTLTHRGLLNSTEDEDGSNRERHLWGSLGHGRLDIDAVWRAYRENLDIALEAVSGLLDTLSGKSVVTSDHGNLVGERTRPLPARGYGHPRGLDVPELRNVPWLVVEADERRSVVAEEPVESSQLGSDVIDDRLSALGYK